MHHGRAINREVTEEIAGHALYTVVLWQAELLPSTRPEMYQIQLSVFYVARDWSLHLLDQSC